MGEAYKALAEQYFRGVYSGDAAVVGKLASEKIVVTYPIFEKLFGQPALLGREAVKNFTTGFSKRWTEVQIIIHEAIGEGNRVVLLWSVRGQSSGSIDPEQPSDGEVHSWGGITLIQFDGSGKIVAEIGEESSPGPAARQAEAAHETPPR